MADLTPQQRIESAEADKVEALRDILRAAARSAAAEAQIMENLVEMDRSMNNAFTGLTGQGPLPSDSPSVVIKELIALVGKELATELLEMGKEYVLEKLRELTGRQHDRADETRANAAQEDTLKGGKTARYRVQAVHDPRLRAVVGLPKVVQASHQSAAHHSLNPKGTMQVRRAIALFWRAPPCTARWVAGAYEELGSKNR